ncbi:MAG: site-specific integrase [Bacteroidales bacterium]|nr:site-specific integrase [Bacteroidales bacterium]
MASLNIYLEKRRDKEGRIRTKNVPVLLYFSFDGQRLQLNTGEKINFDQWDYEKQRVGESIPGSKQVNACLELLADEVIQTYREAKAAGIKPGPEYLRQNLKARSRRTGHPFFEILMKFINSKSEKWSIHTFRKIKTNYNHLREFETKTGYTLDFNRINQDFYEKYINFFLDKGNSNATVYKNLMILKWFLNWATRKGYNKQTFYREYQFPWEHDYKADAVDYYLEWDEIMKLYHASVPDENSDHARNIFCFLCFTGLKYTDLRSIRANLITEKGIRLMHRKADAFVPFNKFSSEIITKYQQEGAGNQIFPNMHIVTLNRLIKQVGKKAGLTGPFHLTLENENEKLAKEVPKYQILSTKVARNSFIVHALQLGIPIQVIMQITALKTLSGVNKFIQSTATELEKEIVKFDGLVYSD